MVAQKTDVVQGNGSLLQLGHSCLDHKLRDHGLYFQSQAVNSDKKCPYGTLSWGPLGAMSNWGMIKGQDIKIAPRDTKETTAEELEWRGTSMRKIAGIPTVRIRLSAWLPTHPLVQFTIYECCATVSKESWDVRANPLTEYERTYRCVMFKLDAREARFFSCVMAVDYIFGALELNFILEQPGKIEEEVRTSSQRLVVKAERSTQVICWGLEKPHSIGAGLLRRLLAHFWVLI